MTRLDGEEGWEKEDALKNALLQLSWKKGEPRSAAAAAAPSQSLVDRASRRRERIFHNSLYAINILRPCRETSGERI